MADDVVSSSELSKMVASAIVSVSLLTIGTAEAAPLASGEPVVSLCSGVRLPPSAVTSVMTPVLTDIVRPLESAINSELNLLSLVTLFDSTPISTDVTTPLTSAAEGDPIALEIVASDGTVVTEGSDCNVVASSFTLEETSGLSIGGNVISGLGGGVPASSGEIGSIAFGNAASTDASATGAIAIGTGATVGADATGGVAIGQGAVAEAADSIAIGRGSRGLRGGLRDYSAYGLSDAQQSTGELSIGTVGAERQVTNLAAGSAGTDAVNVDQLRGVSASLTLDINTVAERFDDHATVAVLYDDTSRTAVTLGDGAQAVSLSNLAAGDIAAGSTDAIRGSQINDLGVSLASAYGRFSSFDGETAAVALQIEFAGNTYTDLQSLFDVVEDQLAAGGGGESGTPTNPYFNAQSTAPDSRAIGEDSIAIGPSATAMADNSIAAGRGAEAHADGSVAIGDGAIASRGRSVSIGYANVSSGDGAVAIGDPNFATGDGAIAMGRDNQATGEGSVALGDTNIVEGMGAVGLGNRNEVAGEAALAFGRDNAVDGDNSLAFGARHEVAGIGSLALGLDNTVTGDQSFAIGNNVDIMGDNTLAIGNGVTTRGAQSTALGNRAAANGIGSSALGAGAIAAQDRSLALGEQARATGLSASALGSQAAASGDEALAVGQNARALGSFATALGSGSVANNDATTAIGHDAQATGLATTAIGHLSEAAGRTSIAIGPGTVANADDSIALGARAHAERGGSSGYDAFGLQAAQTSVGELAIGATIQSISPLDGNAYPSGNRQITGVAAGSEDTDAVNVAQLRGVSTEIGRAVATGLGGNATYDETSGTISGPTYELNGQTHTDVGSALLALSRSTDQLTPLAYAASGDDPTVVNRVTNDAVLVGSGDGPVRLHNVAPGQSATDATNVAQLNGAMMAANEYTDNQIAHLVGEFDTLAKLADAGTATAIAAAQLPQPRGAGRSMFAIGIGHYNGQNGATVGYSRALASGEGVIKLSGSYNSSKKLGIGAGAGWEF